MSRQKKADLTVRKPSSIEAFVRPRTVFHEDKAAGDVSAATEAPSSAGSVLRSGPESSASTQQMCRVSVTCRRAVEMLESCPSIASGKSSQVNTILNSGGANVPLWHFHFWRMVFFGFCSRLQ